MSKKNVIIIFIAAIILSMFANIYSWELYDRVIATVNERPIIESEVQDKFDLLKRLKNIPSSRQKIERSRILDKFIEDALVEETATRESIIVSDEKVDNHIKKMMEQLNISSIEALKKQIEKTEKIPFEEYKKELKKSLMAQDVISIAIGVSPPLLKEASDYYNKNKSKLGFEVNISHIQINLQNDTFTENKRVNKEIKNLYNRINAGEKFEDIAKNYSEDPYTKSKGGDIGWVALSNLARQDMIFANNIYKEFVVGKARMSIIKSNSGYHVVKYMGKRIVSFESVRDEIFSLLYREKQAQQFEKWVYRRRLESDIKIYMEEYVKPRRDA